MRRIARLLSVAIPVLMMVTITLGFGAPPAWAVARLNAVVSATYDVNTNSYHVFWRCLVTDELCEAHTYLRGFHEGPVPLSGTYLLGSQPSASLDLERTSHGQPYQYVFWQGNYPKYDLMEAYYNGRWHGPIDLGMGPLASAPAAPPTWWNADDSLTQYTKAGDAVAWKGPGGKLYYATSTNPANSKSWKGPYNDKVNIGSGSAPSVVDAGGGAEVAFWAGSNSKLYAASFPFDWPEGKTGSRWGPCELPSGVMGSTPAATWFQGVQISTGQSGQPQAAPMRPAGSPRGSCPHMLTGNVSFGNTGSFELCWVGSNPPGKNIYCMDWSQLPSAGNTISGPYKFGSFGFDSAPSVAQFPLDNLVSDAAVGFWVGNNKKRDLFKASIIPPGKAVDVGYGPLTP